MTKTTLNKKAFAIAMICTLPAAVIINAVLPSPDEVAADNKARREAAALVETEVVVPQPVVETPAAARGQLPDSVPAPAPAPTPDMSLAEAKSEACSAMAEYRQYGTTLQAMQELESYARYLAIQTGNPSNRSAIYSAAQYC